MEEEVMLVAPEQNSDSKLSRRSLVAKSAGAIVLAATATASQTTYSDDVGVTAPEDLMKEHGVLDRCLLVYEEAIRRALAKQEISPQVFHQTADLVRRFVEEYHEKNEEKYIFPVFQKAGKLTDLVQTLLTQHKAGRTVTVQILNLSNPEAFKKQANRFRAATLCQSFIRMYRPHKSREDTVLFPALRTILPPKQVASLGDRMEEDEHKVLGEAGFEKCVAEVEALEKRLGIYDLAQFTAKG
jgi:hemerythrin-like domain-containing protein